MADTSASVELLLRAKDQTAEAFESLKAKLETTKSLLERAFVWQAGEMVFDKALEGIHELVGGFIGANAQIETLTTSLTALYSNATQAGQAIEYMTQFSLKAPFAKADILAAGQQIASFGQDITQVLPALGNVAAVMGTDLPSAASALERAIQTGSLRGLTSQLHITKAELVEFGAQLTAHGTLIGSTILPAFEKLAAARFGTGMSTQLNTFAGATTNLKNQFDNLMEVAGKPVFQVLEGELRNFVGFLSAHQADVNNFATNMGNFFGWAARAVGAAFSFIGNAISTFVNWFRGSALPVIEYVVGTIAMAFDSGGWSGVFGAFVDLLAQTGAKIWTQLLDWGAKFVAWIAPRIGPMLVELTKLELRLLAWIIEQEINLGKALVTWSAAFIDWVVRIWPSLQIEMGILLIQFGNWVKNDAAGQFVQWGKDLGSSLVSGFLDTVRGIIPGMGGGGGGAAAGAVAGTASGTPQGVASGQSIPQGMAQGVTDSSPQAIAAANKLAHDMITQTKTVLEAKSPSRVFHGIGVDLLQGLINGIQSKTADLRSAVTAGASSATAALMTTLAAMRATMATSLQLPTITRVAAPPLPPVTQPGPVLGRAVGAPVDTAAWIGSGQALPLALAQGIAASSPRALAAVASLAGSMLTQTTLVFRANPLATVAHASGLDLIQNFIDGIRAKAADVATTVTSAAAGAIDAVQAFITAHLPVPQFAALGSTLGISLAEGLKTTVESYAGAIGKGIGDTLAAGIRASIGTVAAATKDVGEGLKARGLTATEYGAQKLHDWFPWLFDSAGNPVKPPDIPKLSMPGFNAPAGPALAAALKTPALTGLTGGGLGGGMGLPSGRVPLGSLGAQFMQIQTTAAGVHAGTSPEQRLAERTAQAGETQAKQGADQVTTLRTIAELQAKMVGRIDALAHALMAGAVPGPVPVNPLQGRGVQRPARA